MPKRLKFWVVAGKMADAQNGENSYTKTDGNVKNQDSKGKFSHKKYKYPHLQKKYKIVKHQHPKRTSLILEADYGDVLEKTVLTALEKPITTILQKNKEKNPKKISFGYIGTLEAFSYENERSFFFLGQNEISYRIPIDNCRAFIRLYSRISDYFGIRNHKRFKKR